MPIRQLGGFRSPATNPLTARTTTAAGLTVVQSQGSFDTSTVGQARAAGQWTTDLYGKNTVALLQGDGVTTGSYNSTVIDSSTANATTTISQATAAGNLKFNLVATNPFQPHAQSFINTCSVTYSSIGITLDSSTTATIEGWMYLNAYPLTTTTFKNLIAFANTTTGIAWSVGVTSTGYATVFWNDGANKQATGTQYIPLNKWVFVQFIFNAGAISMGVNGVQDIAITGTTTLTTPVGTFSYVTGSERNNIAQYSVFDLRVSNIDRGFSLPLGNSTLPVDANTTLSTFTNGLLVDESATNATLTPSATIPCASPFTPINPLYAPTAVGSFYNGGNSAVSVPTSTNLDVGAGNFTLELWVYPLATLTGGLIGRRATTAAFAGVNLVAASNAITATATVNGSSYGITITAPATAIRVLQWNHIAFVRSANVWTLYINGASVGTPVTLAGTVPASTAVFTTGASSAAFTDYITASYISNVRLLVGTAINYGTIASIPTQPLNPATANTRLLYLCAAAGVTNIAQGAGLGTSSVAAAFPTASTAIFRYGSGSVLLSGTTQTAYTTTPNAQQDVSFLWGGEFTIEGWLYLNGALGTAYAFISHGATGSAGYTIQFDTTGKPVFYNGGTTFQTSPTRYNIKQFTWSHFAIVRSGGLGTNNTAIYINGILAIRGTSTNVFNSASTAGMYFGANQIGAALYNGYMEDVRITKGYARYKEQFSPPPFGLGKQ